MPAIKLNSEVLNKLAKAVPLSEGMILRVPVLEWVFLEVARYWRAACFGECFCVRIVKCTHACKHLYIYIFS